jgi:hypothetical protein
MVTEEMYHIELIDADGIQVLRRLSLRSHSIAIVRERALRALRRAHAPGSRIHGADGVRVLDGAGYELFSAKTHD